MCDNNADNEVCLIKSMKGTLGTIKTKLFTEPLHSQLCQHVLQKFRKAALLVFTTK